MKIDENAEPQTRFGAEALSFQPEIKGLLANRELLKKVEYSDVENIGFGTGDNLGFESNTH